jgi:hypothetical protein
MRKAIGSVFVMVGAEPNSGWLYGKVLHETFARRETRGSCTHGSVNPASSFSLVDGDAPTSIPETASIGCRARTNAR